MNVLSVASECAPLIKTGGLADVVGALPKAVRPSGVQMRTLIPAYSALRSLLSSGPVVKEWPDLFGGQGKVVFVQSDDLELLLLDAPHLYDRAGGIYVDSAQKDWDDNQLRFAALAWAGAQLAVEGCDGWFPDIVHAHDWQAGLLPVYLSGRKSHSGKSLPVVMTVHNIAFQGLFDADNLGDLRIASEHFNPEGVEFHGQIGFLKTGLRLADKVTTVSPTYARELLQSDFGMGLEGVLHYRQADFQGILNGIDLDIWNPETDPNLVAGYTVDSSSHKKQNRSAIERRFGLDENSSGPLFCVISRLTEQKGLDILLESLPGLVEQGASLAVLGTGEAALERGFEAAARTYPGRVGVIIGYDEPLSHLLQGGCDAILVPSRFEPCGLTQLYGLRYGTIPVVAQTGGLADTVIDANSAAIQTDSATGVLFSPVTTEALSAAIRRTCGLYSQKSVWNQIVRRAMQQPVGWDQSAAAYVSLYQSLLH
ncbi:MAG: glycogen synthase GlgA [Granulosicoccus sp.]|nr:glycogen synthase GlgA [Granulosicoccus sp.]